MSEIARPMPPFAPPPGSPGEFGAAAEPYRRELQVHCYRMLGSLQDAEDLVQETLLRAWQRLETYEGRAPFRAWLYKIATNVCLDRLDRRPRRVLPDTRTAPADPSTPPPPPVTQPIWLEPFPDELLAEDEAGPEARFSIRESVTLAFVAALQWLPPRQRAVLILCDVLDWKASEASELLGLSVPAVNSALHRARTTLSRHYHSPGAAALPSADDPTIRAQVERYIRAWEHADINALLGLLKADVTLSMPPIPAWYRGRADVGALLLGMAFALENHGRYRLLPTRANGLPAAAVYFRGGGDSYEPFGIQVLQFDGGLVAANVTFLTPALVPLFGLPRSLATVRV